MGFCSHFHLYFWSNSILLNGSWGGQLAVIALWRFHRHGMIFLSFSEKGTGVVQSRIFRLTNMNQSWKTLTVFLDLWKVFSERSSLVKHVKLMSPGLFDIPAGPNTLLLWAVVWSVCLCVCVRGDVNERVIFCRMQICEQPCLYFRDQPQKRQTKETGMGVDLEIRGLTGVLNWMILSHVYRPLLTIPGIFLLFFSRSFWR